MKHTPGPWTLMDDTTFSTLGDKRIIGANRISPAIVFGGLGAETDANARLIAASPGLDGISGITYDIYMVTSVAVTVRRAERPVEGN